MSIEKSNDFTSIQCGCGITFNFKAPGSWHRIAELEAENARLKEFERALMDMTTQASEKLGQLELAIIPREEYEKIRKLDENVRKSIKDFAYIINNKVDASASEYNKAINGLNLLESLYE